MGWEEGICLILFFLFLWDFLSFPVTQLSTTAVHTDAVPRFVICWLSCPLIPDYDVILSLLVAASICLHKEVDL